HHEIERFIPTPSLEFSIAFDQRIQQTIRMVDLQVSSNSLGAKTALIHWKVVTGLDANDMIVLNQKVHAALHRAVWTMRRHDFVDHSIRAQAIVRRIVKMRAKVITDLIGMFVCGLYYMSAAA